MYRLALLLCTPETFFSLSKLRISLFNVHLALFVQRMKHLLSFNPNTKCRHLVYDLGTSLGSKSTIVAVGRPDKNQYHCRTGEECEREELRLIRSSPLACGVMCSVSSSYTIPCFFFFLAGKKDNELW